MKWKFAGSLKESLALLTLRLPLGVIFVAHGSQKLLGAFGGQGLTPTLNSFEEKLGIPPVLTLLAIIAEFCGGIGVFFGFLTRLSALGIVCVMAVAIYKVTGSGGFLMTTGCRGFEYNVALIGMALPLLFAGAGNWSLDRLFWRR